MAKIIINPVLFLGGVRHLERLTSREELMSIKSIICENVPSILLKQPVLTKHFSKFGEVSRVNINAEAKTATIQFKDHKAAKKAKAKGHSVTPNAPPIGDIFFTKTRRSSEFEEPAKPGVTTNALLCRFLFFKKLESLICLEGKFVWCRLVQGHQSL